MNHLDSMSECICVTVTHNQPSEKFHGFNLAATETLEICDLYFLFNTQTIFSNTLIFSWFFVPVRDTWFLSKSDFAFI